ncbi:MAG TPA: penicillin-binding protein 2, partial [Longimicrobiales bacterium]|nr:penicillin-binding protein 2 [Longimicrobiales bacterium]
MSGPRTHVRRRGLLLAVLLCASVTVAGRAVQLQVVERDAWVTRASEQHARQLPLPAPRGALYDRDGVPLAVSQRAFRVSVAPAEVADSVAAAGALVEALGISARDAARAVDGRRRWVVLPGLYGAPVRERLAGTPGIHFETVLERFHPHGALALEVLGRISGDGRALGGLELELDTLLSGRAGSAVMRRDAHGEPIPGATVTVEEPVAGHDVYLTLDFDLQEIAHEALRHAVEETGSAGGDLLMADPWTGEILAAVSRAGDGSLRWSAVTDPVEPGSTIKPFIVAALLARGRVTMGDSVDAASAPFTRAGRGWPTDIHPFGVVTVRDALERSSNVALARLAQRLTPAEQYAALRDFGFGTPTGVRYPSESGGRLRRPAEWSSLSQASQAIGYEISVTPLQLLMAYGALANGGTLLEPRLVREVHSPVGQPVARFEAARVRRVVSAGVASQVGAALVDVVRAGTAQAASLETFSVAGKTGTARRVVSSGYMAGAYTSTFAGYFPAVDPQLVFLVKLDRPSGAYYGGATAAPVTRETLAAALAARTTPLDRGAIARGAAVPGRLAP